MGRCDNRDSRKKVVKLQIKDKNNRTLYKVQQAHYDRPDVKILEQRRRLRRYIQALGQ